MADDFAFFAVDVARTIFMLVLLVRLGLIRRSFADYEQWEQAALAEAAEKVRQLKAARTETLARDEYKWGVLYLRGDAAIETSTFSTATPTAKSRGRRRAHAAAMDPPGAHARMSRRRHGLRRPRPRSRPRSRLSLTTNHW